MKAEDCADSNYPMTVKIGDILEMRPWIRDWVQDVEVLEPTELSKVFIG